MKECTHCKEMLVLTKFYFDMYRRRTIRCKVCIAKMSKARVESFLSRHSLTNANKPIGKEKPLMYADIIDRKVEAGRMDPEEGDYNKRLNKAGVDYISVGRRRC